MATAADGYHQQYDPEAMRRRARKTVIVCTAIVLGMAGMAYAAVPLYQIFCRVTGYGGTTQVASTDNVTVIDRDVTIRFDSNVNSHLPWTFKPLQTSIDLKVGENGFAAYHAVNNSDEPIVGQATFNVSPPQAGLYFVKTDCFCFTEQMLMPGEEADMPVTFYVDPEIDDDPDLDSVKTITLSYTFFRKEHPTTKLPAKTAGQE